MHENGSVNHYSKVINKMQKVCIKIVGPLKDDPEVNHYVIHQNIYDKFNSKKG